MQNCMCSFKSIFPTHTMAKNPNTAHSAQKLVQARSSASYGEMRDGPSTSHLAQQPVKAKVSAGYGEMSGVESVESCMGSEKLIPNPPCVEDILDWEWVNTEFKSDIAPQSQKMILSDAPLMSLALYYCDVVECSMKEAPLSLAPHQTPIKKAQCRQ